MSAGATGGMEKSDEMIAEARLAANTVPATACRGS